MEPSGLGILAHGIDFMKTLLLSALILLAGVGLIPAAVIMNPYTTNSTAAADAHVLTIVPSGSNNIDHVTNMLKGNGSGAAVDSGIAPSNVGSVTSVGMTVPSIFSIAGSPVTTSGTLALTLSGTPFPNASTASIASNSPSGIVLNMVLTNVPLSSLSTNGLTAPTAGQIVTLKSDGTFTLSNAPSGGGSVPPFYTSVSNAPTGFALMTATDVGATNGQLFYYTNFVATGSGGSNQVSMVVIFEWRTNGAAIVTNYFPGVVTATNPANKFGGDGSLLTGLQAASTNLQPIVATNLGTSTFFTVVNNGQSSGATNLLNLVNMSGNNAIQVQGISDGANGQTNVTVRIPSMIQAGRTNVSLAAATTLTINLAFSFPTTNWVPSLTQNGAAIPGLSFTTITTNSFTTSMTALTFTGNLLWTGTYMTQ